MDARDEILALDRFPERVEIAIAERLIRANGQQDLDEAGVISDPFDLARGVSRERAGVGALDNQIQALVEVKEEETIRLSEAVSALRDVDYAEQMSQIVKDQVLQQSSIIASTRASESRRGLLNLIGL